ncbi:hypothetical protein [Aeromonas tecta]|uniref:hypothetical protein n=1 Tax=Aeromonas tecta TaxID=324617 RepID=UPI0006820A8C|nr:hypothetical protein [Aeromonas tecta]
MKAIPTNSSSIPSLSSFSAKASFSEDRVLSKRGEVCEPGITHRGYKYAVLSEHVLRSNFDRFNKENIKTHLDLKQAMLNSAPPEIALTAYSLLSPAGYRGEPLTQIKLLEVTTLLNELMADQTSFPQIKKLFDDVSRDPRLQACLEQQYPGKMDGFAGELLNIGKEQLRTTGVNTAINLMLPGVGMLVTAGRALHKAAEHCDHEAHHLQVQQIGQLPGRDSRLARVSESALISSHAKHAIEGATAATLGITLGGLSSFGVAGVGTIGVSPLATEVLPKFVGSAVMTGLPMAVKKATTYAIEKEASTTLEDKHLSDILPRLEVSNKKGDFSFSMLDSASVKAMLTYLGPRADEELLHSDSSDAKMMELARIELKKQLGSPANEHLLPGQPQENAPTQALKLSHDAFRKLLAEDYHWLLPAVQTLDKKTGEDINIKLSYSLPLDFDGHTTYLRKSPELTNEQLDALKETGSPSQLKLLYLAEGWL